MTEEINKVPYWLVGLYQTESYTDTLDLHDEKSLYEYICQRKFNNARNTI